MPQRNSTAHPARYSVNVIDERDTVYALVYRNDVLLTQVRERDAAGAIRAARRAVRVARHCGGAK